MGEHNRWFYTDRYGSVGVITLGCPDGDKNEPRLLAKTMFELSRDLELDVLEHFIPSVHTLEVIAAGLLKHFPLVCFPCFDTDLPASRINRNSWRVQQGRVIG